MNINVQIFNILSVKNPKHIYEINKAKKHYLENHKECAICGNIKHIECHHVIPVHIDLNQSCLSSNFISLCDSYNNGCHRWLGHFGNFRTKWNTHVREYAIASRLFLEKMQPERTFSISTPDLIQEFSEALNISKENFLEQVQNFNKIDKYL